MPNPRKTGSEAEDRAASYLQDKGFTIVTRRYKALRGEIDLIALDGETLVFVEVKFSRSRTRPAEEAIVDRKRSRLCLAAAQYLRTFEGPERQVRYDVIAIGPGGLKHTPEAFWPEGEFGDDGITGS